VIPSTKSANNIIEEWGSSNGETAGKNSTDMHLKDVNGSTSLVASNWSPSRSSPLFHIACALLLASYLAPTYSRWGRAGHYLGISLGHFLLSALLLPRFGEPLFWHLGLALTNLSLAIYVCYTARTMRFEAEIEKVYIELFLPLRTSRPDFRKLMSSSLASVVSLHPGECYSIAGVTTSQQRLALLLSGSCSVSSPRLGNLGKVLPFQFLDSPEYEAGQGRAPLEAPGPRLFQVTITAMESSRILVWQRGGLEYLLAKEPMVNAVFAALISRDVCQKLAWLQAERIFGQN